MSVAKGAGSETGQVGRPVQPIGLFGGSFNPPHLAHLALARLAIERLGLAQVLWMPAGQPWQKAGQEVSHGPHRAAMVAELIAGEPGFVLDEREIHRSGPSYTLETVRQLQAEHPGAEIVLIIGQDQYARLHTWHGAAELLAAVTLAVAGREGQSPEPSQGQRGHHGCRQNGRRQGPSHPPQGRRARDHRGRAGQRQEGHQVGLQSAAQGRCCQGRCQDRHGAPRRPACRHQVGTGQSGAQGGPSSSGQSPRQDGCSQSRDGDCGQAGPQAQGLTATLRRPR
ncbi:MAG: nicotinate (nicotinamide) nucleotide adenylyltransferase [Ideonella sp. MAG2]|nr:MAG: nicotinate (nicotinamide) nucleotide adenylyltransferase [Ideonella sp. MAG2]